MQTRLPLNWFKSTVFFNPARKKRGSLLILVLLNFLTSINTFAEGSKELSANGGYRAFLFSSATANMSYPYPTLGTTKVYVKAGETISVGSSAQGIGLGTINLRAPDGSTYTSGTSAAVGLIANRNQELAGPLPTAGGYAPYTRTVLAGQDGVWEVDFISTTAGVDLGNPVPVLANGPWTQPQGQYIAAFDISVRNAANTAFLTGRVYTNEFIAILGTFNVGFNAIVNVLTKDGYQYTVNNNGQAGNGFTFFVNNKGFVDANDLATDKSVDMSPTTAVKDPRTPDTQSDITHKIFFNTPSADLPSTAPTPGGITTWLLSTPVAPTITNLNFIGTEGTIGKGGTSPLGGNFTFTTTGNGSYNIIVDVNRNGVYTDAIDRKLTGTVNTGLNQIFFDGLDGLGNKVPASLLPYNASIDIQTTAGEVHFPFFDVERNVNGIIINRLNGLYAPDDTVYWDDSPITIVGTPSNPIVNKTGIKSSINGHKWGTMTTDPANENDFGNNKSIDTYAYIASPPILNPVSFLLQEADLSVDSITAIPGCAGQVIIYKVTVSNKGPSDATGAQFSFTVPAQITGLTVSSVATTGTSSTSGDAITAGAYNTTINLAGGAVRVFTITGTVATTASGTLLATASILRVADETDPDATDPDAAPPTNALVECNSLPSGVGCNNIKTNSNAFVPKPNAGPDQTVYQNVTVTLAGSGGVTWSQAGGDPALASITSPASPTTTVTGLSALGVYHFIYTNTVGCTDTVDITVISSKIVIPNIFTPNGDGLNDVFKIMGLEGFPGSQLVIYNRWGNEVYRADNYLNNWDGSGLAEATYYYLLNLRDITGKITPYKGWVFLRRSK